MKSIIIEMGKGTIYFQRPRPDTLSQDPYSTTEEIIEHLFLENEKLKSQLEKIKIIIPDLDI